MSFIKIVFQNGFQEKSIVQYVRETLILINLNDVCFTYLLKNTYYLNNFSIILLNRIINLITNNILGVFELEFRFIQFK